MKSRSRVALTFALSLAATAGVARADDTKQTAPPAPPLTPVQAVDKRLDDGAKTLQSGIAKAVDAGDFTVTFTDPVKKAAATQDVATAKADIAAAAASAQQAANLRAEAAKPGIDPRYAESLRSSALQQEDSGSRWLAQANSLLAGARGEAPKPSDGPPRPTPHLDACANNHPCSQLHQIVGTLNLGDETNGLAPFENKAPATVVPAPTDPARDTLLKGRMDKPPVIVPAPGGGASLAPAQGGPAIDLGPLKDAVAEVAPEMRDKPLFTGYGADGEAVPSPELLRVLADPQKNAALRKVGGVALDATFDLLAVSGVSDLRGGGDIKLVDQPVLISLKALYAAAKPYATPEAWDRLPDAVRHPGGVVRINGFVLDPQSGDVILVGRTGEQDARLDIDEIILATRQVWRDGKTMGVSLDPRPDNIGGPQYPRIIDTPPDSIAAKIMIEADYAMKAIMLDAGFAHGKHIVNIDDLMQNISAADANDLSRFWLTPQRLGSGAVYVSASGATTLLETRVQVRTETMVLRNGEIEGEGAASAIPERQAQLFTAGYDAIEHSPDVEPHDIFLRLHGLVDVVTLAKIWRAREIHAEALDRMAELPVRRLSGAEGLPAAYPALSNVFNVRLGEVSASGGVQLNLRQEANAARAYDDHVARALEQAAATGRGVPVVARTIDLTFALPAHDGGGGRDADDAMLSAAAAMRRYDFTAAADRFREVIRDAPADPHGYAGLAFALLEQGKSREAAPYALRAMELAPSDEAYQMLGRDVAWRVDARAAYPGFDDTDRRELSRYYVHWAAIASHDGQAQVRDRDAGWAADLWEDNGDAHILQALALEGDSPAREQQMARAVRAFRRQLEAGVPEAREPLAMALLMSSSQHLLRAIHQIEPGADATPVLALLHRGGDEARQSLETDPDLPAAAASGVLADGFIWLVSTPNDRPAAAAILDRSRALIVRFPKDSGVRVAHAQLLALTGDPKAGLKMADDAVALAPMDLSVRITRAGLRSEQGDCAGAAADFDKARALAGKNLNLIDDSKSVIDACRAH